MRNKRRPVGSFYRDRVHNGCRAYALVWYAALPGKITHICSQFSERSSSTSSKGTKKRADTRKTRDIVVATRPDAPQPLTLVFSQTLVSIRLNDDRMSRVVRFFVLVKARSEICDCKRFCFPKKIHNDRYSTHCTKILRVCVYTDALIFIDRISI